MYLQTKLKKEQYKNFLEVIFRKGKLYVRLSLFAVPCRILKNENENLHKFACKSANGNVPRMDTENG